MRGIGQTRVLNIAPIVRALTTSPAGVPTYDTAAAPPAPAPSPGFWDSASTTEKVLVVGGGLGAAVLLWLAFKP